MPLTLLEASQKQSNQTVDLPPRKAPELLSPAGNWDCARAAVEAGAGAIYFGLESFNARMRADNFTTEDLPELMQFLHRRGVKGYLTLNTLVFENELSAAEKLLREVIRAGVDAAIVQDIGVCRLIRQLSPDFPIHASTQMTITSSSGIQFARELGCHLVVMARECSVGELNKIQAELTASEAGQAPIEMPLEVFIHGALCVAYSGQCLTSESLGGRSANRGECAQACRMTYDLYSDGEKRELGDRRYLLSPQDLMGMRELPELIAAGISSFKIEGRLKTPEYVANVTSAYRQAIDAAMERMRDGNAEAARESVNALTDNAHYDLEMAFSRGLYSGWLRGIDNQRLAHARFGKKRGVFVGRVLQTKRNAITVELEPDCRLKEGDGVVVDQGRPDQGEQGGRVVRLQAIGGGVSRSSGRRQCDVSFFSGSIDLNRVQVGDRLWKTSDPDFEKRWQRVTKTQKPLTQSDVWIKVSGRVGEKLRVSLSDGEGHCAESQSTMILQAAESRPLDGERLRAQFGRLGGTPYRLAELENEIEGQVMLPVSELNRVRRALVEELSHLRETSVRWKLNDQPLAHEALPHVSVDGEGAAPFVVLIRELEQLEVVMASGAKTIYCDFENPKAYRDAVRIYRAERGDAGRTPGSPTGIFVAPPRIHKVGEEWILKQVRSCEPDGFLVRNYDHLSYFAGARLRGDFSFNVANSLTASYLKEKHGLERVTASYDLNEGQLEALLQQAPPDWFEVTLHQHMPMFHMEHCVFCAFMSDGKDYRDCGRPCEKHKVELEDRVGQRHWLKADVGCRNTVYNGRAQTGAEIYGRLVELGVRSFRIEFVGESVDEIRETLDRYDRLRRGELSGEGLWRELKLTSQLGVTRGTMAGSG